MTNRAKLRLAALVCLAGGSLLLPNFIALDALPDLLGGPIEPATDWLVKLACWGGACLCLAGGALVGAGTTNGKRRDGLCVIGVITTLLGVAAYMAGSVYALALLLGQYDVFIRRGFHCC